MSALTGDSRASGALRVRAGTAHGRGPCGSGARLARASYCEELALAGAPRGALARAREAARPARAGPRPPRGDRGSRGGNRHPHRARRDREAGRGRARAGAARSRRVGARAWRSTAAIRGVLAKLPFAPELEALDRGDALQPRWRRQADPAGSLPGLRRGDRVASGAAAAGGGGGRARAHLRDGSRRPARPRRRRDPPWPRRPLTCSSARRRRS